MVKSPRIKIRDNSLKSKVRSLQKEKEKIIIYGHDQSLFYHSYTKDWRTLLLNHLLLLLIPLLLLIVSSNGKLLASEKKAGLRFMITAEKDVNDKDILAMNILPVFYEGHISKETSYKLVSLLNYQIADESNELTHAGIATTLAWYFLPEYYAGGYIGYAHRLDTEGYDVTLSSELGAVWNLTSSLYLHLDLQVGASYLKGADNHKWVDHLGITPSLSLGF